MVLVYLSPSDVKIILSYKSVKCMILKISCDKQCAFLCDLELQNQKAYVITVFSFSRGASKVLLRPQTTQEVSEILAYCNSRRLVFLFVAFILIVVLNLNNMIKGYICNSFAGTYNYIQLILISTLLLDIMTISLQHVQF